MNKPLTTAELLKAHLCFDHVLHEHGEELVYCSVCTGVDGSLPTLCPGRKMTEEEKRAVYANELNFDTGPMTGAQWWRNAALTAPAEPVDSKTTIVLPTIPKGDGFDNGIAEDAGDRLKRLMERALTEGRHSERESFVAENMLSENFEMLDWDADLFACTLGQMLAMLKRYGVRLDEPNTKISSQGVAVDQNYFWDEDMSRCQRGVKYQLLGKGGMPEYKVYDGDPFWVAYALLPKRREPKKT